MPHQRKRTKPAPRSRVPPKTSAPASRSTSDPAAPSPDPKPATPIATAPFTCPCCHQTIRITLAAQPRDPASSARTSHRLKPGLRAASRSPTPRYALSRDGAFWSLVFDGQRATLKHEIGIPHVASLLRHPFEPVPALELASWLPARSASGTALTGIPDPQTGQLAVLDAHARLDEHSQPIGDRETLRALRRQHAELQAIIDDENVPELEKAEAQLDLEENEKFQHQYRRRFEDARGRAARAVRRSICRLVMTLRAPPKGETAVHPLLVRFADHLDQHLLVPSQRFAGPMAWRARGELAGCLVYEPPPGVAWAPQGRSQK